MTFQYNVTEYGRMVVEDYEYYWGIFTGIVLCFVIWLLSQLKDKGHF